MAESKNEAHALDSFLIFIGVFLKNIAVGIHNGLRHLPYRNPYLYWHSIGAACIIHMLALFELDLIFLHWILRRIFTARWCWRISEKPLWVHSTFLNCILFFLALLVFGCFQIYNRRKSQESLDTVSLSNAKGEKPKIVKEIKLSDCRTKYVLVARGITQEMFESKQKEIEMALGAYAESFEAIPGKKYAEVVTTKYPLPRLIKYADVCDISGEAYSFIVGKSLTGIIQCHINDLPHLLIAGTTGSGKTVFFKQASMRLLETSPRIQLYFIDLKQNFEMRAFEDCPNVRVINSIEGAIRLLREIKIEMNRRFSLLLESKRTKIDFELDRCDRIVVAIDEASILFSEKGSNKNEAALKQIAVELTEELAKLCRAAGINLIFATQKLAKEAISTSIQENIDGRMCFKANTLQGSLTMLGSKEAFDLPKFNGRAMWRLGTSLDEIQVPFIEPNEIITRCKKIKDDFASGLRKNYQKMLTDLKNTSGSKVPRSLMKSKKNKGE